MAKESINLGQISDALNVIALATQQVGSVPMANAMLINIEDNPLYLDMLINAGDRALRAKNEQARRKYSND
jgi:hypothetical protein